MDNEPLGKYALEKNMTAEKPSLTRRSFLKLLNRLFVATGLSALLAPVVAYFWPTELEEIPSEPKAIGGVGSIAPGEAVTIPFGRYPALVINVPDRGIVAYSAVCTHFACIVKWNPESGRIECPCHDGYFDPRDGTVISGPPPEPLLSFRVFTQDDTLYIGGDT
jgi:cytochrome b6-f complex iron-sulfur subunit